MTRVFALVDGNNFYCSCERVFNPRLNSRPVIVLSNNDGCAIARSEEAKALGIRMGDPYFKIRDLCRREQIEVFSSNYPLYGDMSRRVMATLQEFTPRAEAYSIDESFLDLGGFEHLNLTAYGTTIRRTVRQWTGIPTCVGIGPTKTLAKVANRAAKKRPEFAGVCDLMDERVRDEVLAWIPCGDIWGVGNATVEKLAELGIFTGADLRQADKRVARQLLTVVGERIVAELNGISCVALEEIEPQRKGMAVTRSFGRPVTTLDEMCEAVSTYATRAGEKLRQRGLAAAHWQVFMHTNKHNGDAWQSAAANVEPLEPTSDTLEIVGLSTAAISRIWKSGFRYAKAGIILTDLIPHVRRQTSLLTD